MINQNFLRTFMKLVSTRHFTKTAEQLHMTQPGVTQHIKKLEAHLGKPILNRFGKSFELTSAGEQLYQFGLKLHEAERELDECLGGDEFHSGECRLASSGSMTLQLYPQLLELQRQHPKLSFAIEAAPNARIIDMVRQNKCEIGLITEPQNDPKLRQEQLAKEPLCLVLPRGVEYSWQDLLQLGFINHPDGHHYAIQVLEANFPEEFLGMDQIPQKGYINQISQILTPVAAGLGFTVLPKAAVESFALPELIYTPKLTTSIKESIYLVSKKHRPLPKRYQLISNLLKGQWQY